jgi:hypothetical protein
MAQHSIAFAEPICSLEIGSTTGTGNPRHPLGVRSQPTAVVAPALLATGSYPT